MLFRYRIFSNDRDVYAFIIKHDWDLYGLVSSNSEYDFQLQMTWNAYSLETEIITEPGHGHNIHKTLIVRFEINFNPSIDWFQ